MGTAGFIVSLVGVLTCGVLCPIGLILSLIGIGKEPKGLAIAGTIIGAVGSLLIVVLVLVVNLLIPRGQAAATDVILINAVSEIEAHAERTGSLPSAEEGQELLEELRDAWGNELRYEPVGDSFAIRSAGPDEVFDTDDDIVSTVHRAREAEPR
jgi:hypothetical protein